MRLPAPKAGALARLSYTPVCPKARQTLAGTVGNRQGDGRSRSSGRRQFATESTEATETIRSVSVRQVDRLRAEWFSVGSVPSVPSVAKNCCGDGGDEPLARRSRVSTRVRARGFPRPAIDRQAPVSGAGTVGRLRPPSVSASRIRLRFQRCRAPVLARWGKGAAACRRSPMPARQFLRMVLPSPCQVSRDQTSTS